MTSTRPDVSLKRVRPKVGLFNVHFSDIMTFFEKSTRNKNDATNKIRENILRLLCQLPDKYKDHIEFGNYWRIVHESFHSSIKKVADETDISLYTSIQIELKGGRHFNHDADVLYYDGNTLIATRKIEFKYGASKIINLPQFLSIYVNNPDIRDSSIETYDTFWYKNYLDKYIACDTEITESKPSLETYLKMVMKTESPTPFFHQLKRRMSLFKNEKNGVVNHSITDYLTKYWNSTINLENLSNKIKTTQTDKHFIMWCGDQFYYDKMSVENMSELTFNSIKNGNVIQLTSGNAVYSLLLRWKNGKGILGPAWQISLKTC